MSAYKYKVRILAVVTVLASLMAFLSNGELFAESYYPVEDGVQESFITGSAVGQLAVADRLDIELHANFMASRTFENDTVFNWFNLGYSGGGNARPAGGTFGDFGLQFPYYERDERYPEWVEQDGITAVSFDGGNSMKADFQPEEGVAGEGDFSLELWVLNEEPADGEVILGWECEEGEESSAPMHWPQEIEGSSQWRHVVVNVEGDEEVLYVDGEVAATRDRDMRVGEEHKMVLGGASMEEPSFTGLMAALRLHNGVLESDEIAHNLEGGPMLGTELIKNVDPELDIDATDRFAEAWGRPDPDNFHTDTSIHFRMRVHRDIYEDEWDDERRQSYFDTMSYNLELAEDVYHALGERTARRVPIVSVRPEYRGDGIKYKVPIQAADGSWMGWHGDLGFGYGCQGRGHFNPHEFVHGCQAQTGGGMMGQYWEIDANFPQTYAGVYQGYAVTSSTAPFYEAHGRDYYHNRNMFEHLTQTPEYGLGFISKLWYDGEDDSAYPWHTFEKYNPNPETCLAYEFGRTAQRNVTWDYETYAGINDPEPHPGRYWRSYEHGIPGNIRHGHMQLREIPYMPGWYRPVKEDAPQQEGWNMIPLEMTSDTVSMELSGYINEERGSNWRAGFVAVDGDLNPRYSDLIEAGESLEFELEEGEEEVYITVAGTPDRFDAIGLVHDPREPEAEQFVYKLRLEGAVQRDTLWEYYDAEHSLEGVSGDAHPNGGGFVADAASVEESVYVGPDARVLGGSELSGEARIEGEAIIYNSVVRDQAVVSGRATVLNGSTVRDNAIVSGHAELDGATVEDYARVRDKGRVSSSVSDTAKVAEHATSRAPVSEQGVIKGHAYKHAGYLRGNAVIDGSYNKGNEIDKGRWFQWSWGVGQEEGEVDEDFNDLYADISFDQEHPWMARDDFNLTWGYLINDAALVEDDERGSVLELNGEDQFVDLPGDVVDQVQMTMRIWVKWDGGDAGQPVFDFGIDGDNSLTFTPSGDDGNAELVLTTDGEAEKISAAEALPEEQWADVVVTGDPEDGFALYIDGELTGENEAMNILPMLRSSNYFEAYLGRSIDGDSYLSGRLDNFQIYTAVKPLEELD